MGVTLEINILNNESLILVELIHQLSHTYRLYLFHGSRLTLETKYEVIDGVGLSGLRNFFGAELIDGRISANIGHPGVEAAFRFFVGVDFPGDFDKCIVKNFLCNVLVSNDSTDHCEKCTGVLFVQILGGFAVSSP